MQRPSAWPKLRENVTFDIGDLVEICDDNYPGRLGIVIACYKQYRIHSFTILMSERIYTCGGYELKLAYDKT